MDSSELLEALFQECSPTSKLSFLCSSTFSWTSVFSLLFALCFRIFMSILTFGCQVPAGVFIPSMVWGGLFGRLLGLFVETLKRNASPNSLLFASCHLDKDCISPGMYALLGAFSALGGVTRLTLSLTVIMFELTGTLEYIVPCMLCLTISKLVGDFFGKKGFVEAQIEQKSLPFLDPREEHLLGLRVQDIMTPFSALKCFTGSGMRISDIESLLFETEYQGFAVVQSQIDPVLQGFMTRGDVEFALNRLRKAQGIDPTALVFFTELPSKHSPKQNDANTFLEDFTTPSLVKPIPDALSSSSAPLQYVDLSHFMDCTPLGVPLKLPVELIIDLFTKLGPRTILVKENGRLEGLITKKDVLQCIELKKKIIYS
jgi:chloride channel 3/4/5